MIFLQGENMLQAQTGNVSKSTSHDRKDQVSPHMRPILDELLTYVEKANAVTAKELEILRERGDVGGSNRKSNPNDVATHVEHQNTRSAIGIITRNNSNKAINIINLILKGWDGSCRCEECEEYPPEQLPPARILSGFSTFCIECATRGETKQHRK